MKNWKIKSKIYKILSFLKLYKILFFIQKRITKRSITNYKEIPCYWDYHFEYLKENNSKSLIEIGAGKDLAQNIYLCYKFDKKLDQTLIDVSNMLDLDLFNRANEQISKLIKMDKLPNVKTINDLKKFNINYIAPMSLKKIAERNLSFDACISSTTLEHLPMRDLRENFSLLKDIIKKDGIISASIDYSDHYSHTDKNIGSLNFLQYDEDEWKKYNTPMLFQNRLRHQDYRDFFKFMGYKVSDIKGSVGKYPKIVSKKFDTKNKETLILWGHFLLKH